MYDLYAIHPNNEAYSFVKSFDTLADLEQKLKQMKESYESLGLFGFNVQIKIQSFIRTEKKP